MHLTRTDIEVDYFGRDSLEAFTNQGRDGMPSLSLPFVLFIDDFEVYHNIYRALKAFYLIPICLDYIKRQKPSNGFTLILGLYDASFYEVVGNIQSGMKALCHSVTLDIGREKL